MTTVACIGEPISWPRLETFAAGHGDPQARAQIDAHVAACPACRHCLHEIRADLVALPPLIVAVAPTRRARRPWWLPALGLAAAAAIAILVLLVDRRGASPPARGDVVAIKGVGDVLVEVVRERAGAITFDARTFAPGDRWKVAVTCPPTASATFTVEVTEIGGLGSVDRPLPTVTLACGNRVVLPGAFTLTGPRANRMCVQVTRPDDHGQACIVISPE